MIAQRIADLTPTSGWAFRVAIILAMGAIPFDRWLKFVVPFMIKIWIVGSAVLVVAVWIGYR